MRKIIVIALTLFVYGYTVYILFIDQQIWRGMVVGLALFILMYFFALETQDRKWYHFFVLFGSGAGLTIVLSGISTILGMASVILFHIALYWLIYNIHEEITNSKEISLRQIVHSGAYVFSALMTVSYSMWSVLVSTQFSLTCDQLYNTVDSAKETILTPLNISVDKVRSRKDMIMGTSDMTLGDAIGVTSPSNPLLIRTESSTGIVEHSHSFGEQIVATSIGVKNGVLGKLELWKQKAVDKVMESSKQVNKKICTVIVDAIKKGFSNPVFQYSIVVLMFLLLAPFVRIVIYILEVILFLLLQVFFMIGLYRKAKKQEWVEEVQ